MGIQQCPFLFWGAPGLWVALGSLMEWEPGAAAQDGAVWELSPPKFVTSPWECPCQPQECQGRAGKGRGGGNPRNSSWKHKDHPPCLGFWDGVCCPLELLRAPRLGPPGYESLPSPSPDLGVTGAPEAGNHFPWHLLVFFFPESSKESPWLLIPSHGWVGKSDALLPWAGASC